MNRTIFFEEQSRSCMRWQCPFCLHTMEFRAGEEEIVLFLVVNHCTRKHAMTRAGILRYDPSLEEAADEYFGAPALSPR